jgi:hypothetical protein
MRYFKIVTSDANIGWKGNDHINQKTEIKAYPTIEDLIMDYGITDKYDPETDTFDNSSIIWHIERGENFYFSEHHDYYWPDPEPADAYLTYASHYNIKEIPKEDYNKHHIARLEKLDKKKEKNKKLWLELFSEQGDIQNYLIENYKFPKKYSL